MPANRSDAALPDEILRQRLERELGAARGRMGRLIAPLDEVQMHRQYDRIMSPLVWNVKHVSNFEELWLLRQLNGQPAHDPALDNVYNPFKNPH